ncbi:MAG TPA: M1 family aminopeptidase, partial [Pirellulaceae bacterium]|nr:M1 family aminopeptidase [Pirellulaceae bacterium]
RFSFTERSRPVRGEDLDQSLARHTSRAAPTASDIRPLPVSRQLLSQIAVDARGILSSNVFRAVMAFALFILVTNLWFSNIEAFGLASLPVTYKMIDIIRGSLYIFLLAIVTFFAGVLVWKEREARLDEVYDALPHPTWLVAVGKFVALLMVVVAVLVVGWLSGMATQLANGYQRFQTGVYLSELLGWDLIRFTCLCALAVLIHVISPNKYVGYFGFVLLIIVNQFIWSVLGWESRMWMFVSLPSYTYSDLFGIAPYLPSLAWFSLYWLLFAGLLAWGAIAWWPRGKEKGIRPRWKLGVRRWQGALRWGTLATLLVWLCCAAWVFYNTQILNHWKTRKQVQEVSAQYETLFRDQSQFPQPRVTHIRYEIDIDPPHRGLELRGEQRMVNRSAEPIERLYVNTADKYETTLDIPGATLEDSYPHLHFFVYRLDSPLAPNEEITIRYTVSTIHRGFENSVSNPELVQNGSFFNNMIVPQFGYQPARELSNPNERRRRGLGSPRVMPPLDPHDLAARSNHYISNHSDWVEVESIISTTEDQIAIAPGSLQRKWVENGRRYFHYRLDHPSLNFYAFMSARYEVAVREWNGVTLEVYYHPEHYWNVDKMLASMRDTLSYCTEQFGPYRHRQARIIEFPRIASFAQAFPGTMPYSEGIGFIADLRDPEDIDMVFYVVAHEMGHQWWAHQVVGANMQGATVLSETLAQYTALMVMERQYGRDMMRKFLRYEMDRYLRSRGNELLRERPLIQVEAGQGYIHYNKGSVVMYQLKELLGEERVNTALRMLVEKFGYASAPYPTSLDLLEALREVAGPEHQTLLTDLFERIVLYDQRAKQATYRPLDDGSYEVELEFECRKFAMQEVRSGSGVAAEGESLSSHWIEVEEPMDEWVEIGAFAVPPTGQRYGATLHRQRVKATTGTNRVRFIVAEIPHRAGVDPFSLQIDRVPDDNLKSVTLTP